MKLMKKTVHSMPAFVKLIVELTQQGKEINLNYTRASYALNYLVAWYEPVVETVNVAIEASIVAENTTEEPKVDEDSETSPITFEKDLTDLSLQELRDLCDAKGIKYAPATKSPKLIELLSQ
jgi:hypothetical protein